MEALRRSFRWNFEFYFQFPRRTLSAFEIIRVVCGLILKLNLVNRLILVNLKKFFFGFLKSSLSGTSDFMISILDKTKELLTLGAVRSK